MLKSIVKRFVFFAWLLSCGSAFAAEPKLTISSVGGEPIKGLELHLDRSYLEGEEQPDESMDVIVVIPGHYQEYYSYLVLGLVKSSTLPGPDFEIRILMKAPSSRFTRSISKVSMNFVKVSSPDPEL
jgi:hypothetical protein